MKNGFILLMLIFHLVGCNNQQGDSSQGFSHEWSMVEMNDSWRKDSLERIKVIVDKFSPGMKPLMAVEARSSAEITKKFPESALSNLAADIIADAVLPFVKEGDKVVSITNFGGIRSDLPKGDIRIYDIYSVFPFDNKIVVVDILGSDLRKIYDRFARLDSFQAVGGVRMVIDGKGMIECEVGGEPLVNSEMYKLATIDFLLGAAGGMQIEKYAKKIIPTDILLRDAVVSYMKKMTAQGHVFDNKIDGRLNFK